jgi:hypothetical protein
VNRSKKCSSFGIKARKLAWHKRLARPLEEGVGPQRYRGRAVLIEAMRGSFKQQRSSQTHRVLSPGSCGHQAAERAADGGASSMSDDLPKRGGGCSGTISGVRAQRRRRSCRGNASQAGCGPPSCVRHLMFKFWELSAINCCGTHLCSRQPQLRFRRMQRFGLGECNASVQENAMPEGENTWNTDGTVAVADFGIGSRENGVRQLSQCRNLQRESPLLPQRSVQRASACAHPGTRRRPSKIQP